MFIFFNALFGPKAKREKHLVGFDLFYQCIKANKIKLFKNIKAVIDYLFYFINIKVEDQFALSIEWFCDNIIELKDEKKFDTNHP